MTAGREPTDVAGCQLRPAEFSTLTEALDYAARGRAGFNFYSAREELLEALPYRDLRDQALSMARRMLNAGLTPGDRVALVAETGAPFMRTFFACQYAGLIPVPMPTPAAFVGRDMYVEHVRPMLAKARPAAVLAPGALLGLVRQAAGALEPKALGTFELFDELPENGTELPRVSEGGLSYLQFSSGSTRSPTGVSVTQRALLANLRSILRALDARGDDRATSWLPFYHDMGLVGFILTPLAGQASADYVSTDEFARRPLIWPTLISRNGATISYSPSFGYELCTRRAMKVSVGNIDLATWRVAGIGGDMIRPRVLGQFAETFGGCGFRQDAFVASYGMAEATLAISFAPLDRGLEIDRVDLDRLRTEARAVPANGANGGVRELVFCGRVVSGHELEIRDERGRVLGEREVGRILIRGPSVMKEYFRNSEETERVMIEGWLDTGDLGYLAGGSLVVAGRSKDLILVNGRNIWPQDLEWEVEHQVEGVRPGDVAAFSLDEAECERVVVLVVCRMSDTAMREKLRRAVGEAVLAAAGLHCTVALVPPNSLPRTSSGKLSRTRARQSYLAETRTAAEHVPAAMTAR
ncbi:MAG: fatty acyl-AMP ligase [Steroidobacteraceae bacterium]